MKPLPNPIRVLGLDDREAERSHWRTLLSRDTDLEVVAIVDDPGEFLRLLGQQVHVAILDMSLYGDEVAGLRVLAEAEQLSPSTRCLILTTYPSVSTMVQAIESGAEGYLSKEKEDQGHFRLADVVRSLAAGARLYDGELVVKLLGETRYRHAQIGDPKVRRHFTLTSRQLEVLRFVAEGRTNAEIARELVLSVQTVNSHLDNIFQILDVRSRHQAVDIARENGLI